MFAKQHKEKFMWLAVVPQGFIGRWQGRSMSRPCVKCGMILCCRGSGGLLLWRQRFGFFPAHADKL